jgi:CubicO group peptidase (beta-lactamase class C family)
MSAPDGAAAPRRLARALQVHARAGDWPGATYAVGPPGPEPAEAGGVGRIGVERDDVPDPRRTLYDLASLTKPLLLGAVLLRLSARGDVDPDAPLEASLPELVGYAGRTPSFTDLMAHRAGLPAWRPLYRLVRRPDAALEALAAMRPEAPAGSKAIYSCLGPIAAGLALERASGASLAALFAEHVAEPLELPEEEHGFGTLGAGPAIDPHEVAPTERGRRREAELAVPYTPRGAASPGLEIVPGDDRPLVGETHDGNARFLGGLAGNAGLFSTARAAFRIASAVSFPGALVDERAAERATRPVPPERAGEDVRTFGFQHGRAAGAPVGALGADSWGHVGFTGTSVWIRRESPLVVVVLTNRVHPRWTEAPVQSWRRALHDAATADAVADRRPA